MPTTAAIILAGGTSERMGTDKLALEIAGQTLLDRAVAAASSVAKTIVVAGTPRPLGTPEPVTFVLENPPLGGPLAGIAAALASLPAEVDEVLVLAGDLAHPDEVVALLTESPRPSTTTEGRDGLALVDDESFVQYLAACYRRTALAAAIGSPDDARDRGVRRVLHTLDLATIPAPTSAVADLDTPDQARDAGARPGVHYTL
ncbi:molybdenum cofactor guanylyltransferase [Aestuariimicrobium soli]|uniref:molybdenum cofactor guanylyltransferase n=1 Tax=Aestuariimicrobium soli TaxID=2035834 RepID=UPI003EBDF219